MEMEEKLIGLKDLKSDNYIELNKSKYKIRIKFPIEACTELASLLGHALGDGHIKKNGEQFQYFNKNKELVDNVRKDIRKIFGIDLKTHLRKDSYIYCIYAPAIVAKILITFGAPMGRKTTKDIVVPEWIIKGSTKIKKFFIRALFDDEGWVGVTQGNFAIGFGQNKKDNLIESHRRYMEQIKNMLQEFGIETSEVFERSKKGDSIQLGFKIIGYDNIKKFLDEIGFGHKLKQEKSLRILNEYKQIQYSKRKAKLKVLEALRNGPLRSKQLGLLLNRDQKTIWKHLNQLRKKNLVVKVGTKNKVFWKINDLNNINP
jgi:intein/homing endonuclease